jgi:hypothetical protein
MFTWQLAHGFRIEDRLPRVFAPRVAPDPDVQQKLAEKIARSHERLRERTISRTLQMPK